LLLDFLELKIIILEIFSGELNGGVTTFGFFEVGGVLEFDDVEHLLFIFDEIGRSLFFGIMSETGDNDVFLGVMFVG
jgi:hypothetical protein